jgi:hypothetical protein
VDYLILAQPSYLKGMSEVLAKTPLDTIKVLPEMESAGIRRISVAEGIRDESFAFAQTARRTATGSSLETRRASGGFRHG